MQQIVTIQQLDLLTLGAYNVAVGKNALEGDTKGSKTVAIGRSALATQNFTTATDTYNTAVGYYAGNALTTGTLNTTLGGLAGDQITTGVRNICIGYDAGKALTTGSKNILIGSESAINSSGTDNVIVMGYDVDAVGANNFTFGNGNLDSNIAFGATTITQPYIPMEKRKRYSI